MYKIFTIILVFQHDLFEVSAENKTETIEALEKEKGKLFDDINTAIDESVRSLKVANDPDSALGVTYMQQLKEQLKNINGTEFKDLEPSNDTRRSDNLKLSMKELATVFQTNKNNKIKIEKDENKIEIQKKITEWILQREAEKKKIREYRERMNKNHPEKCPRYGVGKKKGKSLRRRASKSKRKRDAKKYPCCRKCCKKSYMGCL